MSKPQRDIDGIESLPQDARFVGNGMSVDGWDKAKVWTDGEIDVEDGVDVEVEGVADGTAPAVTCGGLDDEPNQEVKGMTTYILKR